MLTGLKSPSSCASLFSRVKLLLNGRVEVWIGKVDIGHKLAEKCFGALQAALKGFDILRSGIPPAI